MGEVNEALDEDTDKSNTEEKGPEKHGDIEETDFDAISMDSIDSTVVGSDGSDIEPEVTVTALDIGLLICVPFAASIGGTGTFTGTDLNLYLSGYYNDFYAEYTTSEYQNNGYFAITYANWAMYNLLPSFLTFFLSYIWLQGFNFGWNPISWFKCEKNEGAENVINTEFKKLGPMKQGEYVSLFCFIIVVILWIAREPTDGAGWAYIFPVPSYMTDGMVVILIGICLFVLPIDDSGLFCIFNRFRKDKISINHGPARPILTWDVVQRRTGWGVLILIGGGYAIAQASDDSGFSEFVATGLAQLVDGWESWAICLLCSIMASMFTEITSNTAACALFVPLLNKLALKVCVHPLYLCLPATVACSMSFMLPAATPPNAIAFGSGRLKSIHSITNGFMPKIIGVGLINAFIMFFGPLIYKTDIFPCFALGDPTGAHCYNSTIHAECPCYPSSKLNPDWSC
ncbi:Oidioi.mRNA.OKI2018_I69.XSR.g15512.t1.cds [Oikopleura dioica]|uniref:Oidioi.mRNA.OKI2018_I69.XSR.g15512.t1.cds n=1 Tax=Oikopleura dioica TaxID=34765 RepID=A0ABN7SMB6_OIKDI|nr:Oidioi.mRNA.OKI2018_I69.XSR.g15512.t1.cds [Oikopleura dioica]